MGAVSVRELRVARHLEARDTLSRRLGKLAIFLLCLLPAALLVRDAMGDALGANPVEALLHATGDWTLRMLLITLAVTPVRRLSGWAWPLRLRR